MNDNSKKMALQAGGFVFLALAIVGVLLPIVPQVPFAIIAAYLFSKSSPKFHARVRNHRVFGEPVRDWEDNRVVKPKLKILSTVFMIGGAAIGHWQLPLAAALALDCVFLASITFVATRNSEPPVSRGPITTSQVSD